MSLWENLLQIKLSQQLHRLLAQLKIRYKSHNSVKFENKWGKIDFVMKSCIKARFWHKLVPPNYCHQYIYIYILIISDCCLGNLNQIYYIKKQSIWFENKCTQCARQATGTLAVWLFEWFLSASMPPALYRTSKRRQSSSMSVSLWCKQATIIVKLWAIVADIFSLFI